MDVNLPLWRWTGNTAMSLFYHVGRIATKCFVWSISRSKSFCCLQDRRLSLSVFDALIKGLQKKCILAGHSAFWNPMFKTSKTESGSKEFNHRFVMAFCTPTFFFSAPDFMVLSFSSFAFLRFAIFRTSRMNVSWSQSQLSKWKQIWSNVYLMYMSLNC